MLRIRTRTAEDLARSVQVLEAVHRVDRYPMRLPADPAGWLSPAGGIGAWVGEHDGELVGHVALVAVDGSAEVTRLFTAPTARRRGVARRLLDTAVAHATRAGRPTVLEVVEDSVAAVALYERLGWRLLTRRPAEWTTPDGRRPWSRRYAAPGPEITTGGAGASPMSPPDR